MARVEKYNPPQGGRDISSANHETDQEEEFTPRSGGSKLFSCLLIFFIILFALGLWIAWVVASTGLVNIPVISSFAYEPANPIRRVIPGTVVETYLNSALEKEIAVRLQAGGQNIGDHNLSFTLPEEAVTASLQTTLKSVSDLPYFEGSQSQVVFDKEKGMELYFPLKDSPNENAVRIYIFPEVENDQLSIKSADFWVGNFHTPSFITSLVIDSMLRSRLYELNDTIDQYASINEITIDDGSISLSGELAIDIMQLR